MLSTAIHRLHDLFQWIRFFAVFDILVRLLVVTKRVLHSKTWLEHCILAKVGVCYRSVGEVKSGAAWGSLR